MPFSHVVTIGIGLVSPCKFICSFVIDIMCEFMGADVFGGLRGEGVGDVDYRDIVLDLEEPPYFGEMGI